MGGNGTSYFGAVYYYIDGVSVTEITSTAGIDEIKNKSRLEIYPNPSNGNMTIDYKIQDNPAMEILDMSGNLTETYNLPVTGNRIEIKNERLQNGVYLYRITGNNAVIKFGKVVIMK